MTNPEGSLMVWRVRDRRGLGCHSSWQVGEPYKHLEPEELEIVEMVPLSAVEGLVSGFEEEIERLRKAGDVMPGGWGRDLCEWAARLEVRLAAYHRRESEDG